LGFRIRALRRLSKTNYLIIEILKTHLIINFFGNTRKEYVELAKRFDHVPGISALEMNISCPNIKRGGIVFGTDPQMAYRLVQAVRKVTVLPLMVNCPPM